MMVGAAPQDGDSNQLCDWLELAVLASRTQKALLSSVNLGLEMEEDFEDEDFIAQDEIRERRIQCVVAAIDERTKSMGASYPFEFDDTRGFLKLKENPSPGGYAYLFCLIVSNAAKDGLLHDNGPWKPDLKKARDLFQVCATVASAGFVRGPAFSVGYPRPDHSKFLEKLHQIYPSYCDGRPHPVRPSWANPNANDDEIDVVAFRHEPDGLHGSQYLVAQAASGANYPDKSIKNAVGVFHQTWFVQQPATPATPGLLFPFVLRNPKDGEDHVSQQQIEGEHWRTISVMGVLLFRGRLARYIDVAVELAAEDGIKPIERLGELSKVAEWVAAYVPQLIEAVEELA
ncbi:MAG: hypothetical protein JO257_05940 [Deltaproteobacteria bacterium]|nr:hypothetical protein [Deltaproteobacteria bacterium]